MTKLRKFVHPFATVDVLLLHGFLPTSTDCISRQLHYGPAFNYNGFQEGREGGRRVREHSYTHAGSGLRVMRYDAGGNDDDDYYYRRRGGDGRERWGWRERFRCW